MVAGEPDYILRPGRSEGLEHFDTLYGEHPTDSRHTPTRIDIDRPPWMVGTLD